jgi:quercetin dioxygenase-like cupin family protein
MNITNYTKEGLKLENLVEYQNGSVVSKALIKKKAGTVTLFAFDKGEELSEHTAPYDAYVHIISGKAEIIISGETYMLKTGEFIILPANKPHALKASESFKMLLVLIKEK